MRAIASIPAVLVSVQLCGCVFGGSPGAGATIVPGGGVAVSSGRGFPVQGPWVSYYGSYARMGDPQAVAGKFRIINLDADPGTGNYTAAQIAQLKAGGRNRVISYFNLGACETFRSYWSRTPQGFMPAGSNRTAQLGPYKGYPDEIWMNLGNSDYQHLLLDYVAPQLVAQGVDGFYFDNLELLEHDASAPDGPCDDACRQGGLDLVRKLREKYPDLLFVMQNGTGDVTRLGTTGGVPYPSLLDGVAHEDVYTRPSSGTSNATDDVYAVATDSTVEAELTAWASMRLLLGGRPFWIATEDYVNQASNTADAQKVYGASRARGYSPYASDRSAGQQSIYFWPF